MPTVQKTRLIHAAVRHFITGSGRWDVEADGVPVCQQDMLGALLIFSVQVVDGMRRIGISVTEHEAASYYYVWRVTGAMLGIPVEAMPESIDEARELNAVIVGSTYGPSAEGVALTRNLIRLYEDMVPGKAFDGVVSAMVRQTVDPQVADWMEVPNSRTWNRAVRAGAWLMRVLERAEDRSNVATSIFDKAGSLLLGGSVRTLTNGQSTALNIPADLREKWLDAGVCPVTPARDGGIRKPAAAQTPLIRSTSSSRNSCTAWNSGSSPLARFNAPSRIFNPWRSSPRASVCRAAFSMAVAKSPCASGSLAALWIRIQLPPGSTTVDPVYRSLRSRGRVMRGMPETSSFPCMDRIPAANASNSSLVSSTMSRHVLYDCAGS